MIFNNFEIDESLKREVAGFVTEWNQRFAEFPFFTLDYSWPSLGIIDLFTFSLRYKFSLTEDEDRILALSSLYLSCVIANLRSDGESPAKISLSMEGDVLLFFYISDQKIVVHLKELLGKTLREINNFIPISPDFNRPISYDTVVIPSFTLSIVAGTSPLLKIDRKTSSVGVNTQEIADLQKTISVNIAKWFEKHFPRLEMSHVPELYLKGFIWPPLLMEETPPLVKATNELLNYCNELKLPLSYLRSLLEAFALCPDEQVAGIAVAVSGVFRKVQDISICTIGSARSRRYLTPLLRAAFINSASYSSEIMDDWTNVGLNQSMYNLFEIEIEVGTLPWLSLSREWLANEDNFKKISNFIQSIKIFDFDKSVKYLDDLVVADPSDIELRIQQVKLEFIRKDFETCHELCKRLVSEPKADSYPEFFNLWGLCLLSMNEPELSARYFRAAKAIKHTRATLKAEILNNLAWSNIHLGQYDKAKNELHEAEALSLCPVTVWLNLAFIAGMQKDSVKRQYYLKKSVQVAPYDRRVFGNLI